MSPAANTSAIENVQLLRESLPARVLADYLGVSRGSIDYWSRGENEARPKTAQKIGELAAVVHFLQDELSFSPKNTGDYLQTTRLDPDTYNPISAIDMIREGEMSRVIQEAIELSIVSD